MDKEFFINSSIPPQLQYDQPFSSTIPTWQSQDYFLSTPPSNDHFESALSSMVSSPTASNSVLSTDNFMMRELIGKLGNICNSNDLPNYINSTNCSTNNSCYSTPLSSPPKISRSMPILDHMMNENFPCLGSSIGLSSNLPAMPCDPGFAERAARFSSFGSRSFNQIGLSNVQKNGENEKLQRVSSSPLLNDDDKQCGNLENGSNRKRKSTISKRKGKEIESHSNKVAGNGDESNAKRSKSDESNGKKGETTAKTEENKGGDDDQKCHEATKKDYIHVRARRGQATDSHSLAERVRREKISVRMKLLQDLVPGCNRVTGKALMLDEIINYVQSLQRQVEFLSMKLSAVNPTLEFNVDNLFITDEMKPNWCMPNPMYPTMVPTQYGQPHQNPLQDSITTAGATPSCSVDPLTSTLNHNHVSHLSSIHGFSNSPDELPSLFEGGLQSVVEMRFGQKENVFQSQKILHSPNLRQMKKEF